MNRRQWIGSGVAAAALLVVAGAYRFRALSESDRDILAAIGPVMLAGSLPQGDDAMRAFVEGFDKAVAGLTPSVQAEIAQLFTILRVPPLRMLATGVMRPWHLADGEEIARFLNRWRYSNIIQLRSAYDALHQLSHGAWYGNPRSWPQTGYPGPPKLS
ncbi:MAG: hypothetical protein JO322_14780 [Candidatus Eremiobacteraeota bacterium]|nr:hypothetical protein [Candidatus Eremiobacteraeota bacterium]